MFNYTSKILYIIGVRKQALLFIMFLCLLVSLLEALGIGLIGPFVAFATNPETILQNDWMNLAYTKLGLQSEIQFVVLFGLVIIVVLYFKAFLGFNIQRYIFKFGFGQQANLRLKLTRAYLTVPYTFHLSHNTALLIQNIVNETLEFANGVLMPILFSFSNFTIACALVILLLTTNFLATTIILVAILLAFCILYQFRNTIIRWGKEASETSMEMIRIINHALGGLKETRVIGCESYFENQMYEQARRFKEVIANYNAFSSLPRYVLEALLITFLVAFTTISLISHQSPQSLASTLGIFAMASFRLLPAVSSLMQAYNGIKRSNYIVDKIYFDLKELEKVAVVNNIESLVGGKNLILIVICLYLLKIKLF